MLSMIVAFIKILILINCWSLNEGQLIDYPLEPIRGSVTIASTLTDQSNQETYTVKETLIEHPKIHGKIEITHRNDQIQVFYHEDYPSTRLVMHENECHKFEYNDKTNSWNLMIPTVAKPFLNTALLLGPSLYYRLVPKMNKAALDGNVDLHGDKMRNYRLRVGQDLKVSFMFPVETLKEEGIKKPERLKLVSSSPRSVTLFYDIHYEKQLTSFDETWASPTLGIGCSIYFSVNRPFPFVGTQPYHVKIIETYKVISSDTKSAYDQMFVDPIHNVSYISTAGDQFLSWVKSFQKIVDYDLGIQYQFADGRCKIMTIVSDLELYRYDGNLLAINPITLGIQDFKYVGQVNYLHRSRLVDVWESTELNIEENYNTYDKVVTTHFMLKQSNNSGSGYVPIAMERKFYKKISDKLKLIESKQRDFFEYDEMNYDETDYRQSFQLSDCYDSPDDKMYLTLQIHCEDTNQGHGIAAKNLYTLRETIAQIISTELSLSYLRITSINIEFESTLIEVKVEIIREPDIPSSLQSFDRKYTLDSFIHFRKVSIKDPVECLRIQSLEPVKTVISCMGLDNLCVGLYEGDQLPEKNLSGSYCTVYGNALDTLKNLANQVTLKQLTNRFTKLNGYNFEIDCVDCPGKWNLTIINVLQDSPPLVVKENRLLFKAIESGAKLSDDQGTAIFGATTFGECFQACATSNEYVCETFSFCQSAADQSQTECHLTGKVYESLKDDTVSNAYCSVYVKNKLFDYHKISSTKFIDSRPGPNVRTEEECARACAGSNEDCYSFQICDSRYCSFSGQLTFSNMVSANFCDVFIPKKIHDYVKHDKQILISSFISSEVDLTLDQCASLCSFTAQTNGNGNACKSFNFCPKGEGTSLCQLLNETISSAPSSSVSTSNYCSNYEENGVSKQLTPKHRHQRSSSSSVLVLIFFTIFGLTIGLATSWAHKGIKEKFRKSVNRSSSLIVDHESESVI